MKKTLTINLSGIVYHIDEDAYDILQNYLQTLSQHFAVEESSDEIMSDIESRISELLQLKIKNQYQVITIVDVQEIIKIMGTPEDFGIDSDSNETKSDSGRATRDSSHKRLYRDYDDRVLGGVCSGIAYYFNVDVALIRLIFVLTFFIAGPLIYFIAWIVIPRAETTNQKVEMRGDRIDIESIKQRVKEEFEDVKSRFTEYGNSFKDSSRKHSKYNKQRSNSSFSNERKSNFSYVKSSDNSNRTSSFLVQLGAYMLRTVLFFVGLIIIAFIIALVFGFSLDWFNFSNFAMVFPQTVQNFTEYIYSSESNANLAIVGLVILICMPLLLILWGVFSLLFGFKKNSRIIGYIVILIWVTAFSMIGISVYHVVQDFKEKAMVTTTISVKPDSPKEFIISLSNFDSDLKCANSPNNVKQYKHWAFVDCVDKVILSGVVDLEVKHALQDSISVEIYSTSRGKTKQEAEEIAQRIFINAQLTDSTLKFAKYFPIQNPKQWRKQRIQVLVKLPENMKYKIVENGILVPKE